MAGKIADVTTPVFVWHDLADEKGDRRDRRYAFFVISYSDFREFFEVKAYSDAKGQGFQREADKSWTPRLAREMRAGNFSPTAFYAGIYPVNKKQVVIRTDKETGEEVVDLFWDAKHPFSVTDGGHRRASLDRIIADAKLPESQRALANNQQIPIMMMLDEHHVETDFLNYQKGKPVNKTLKAAMEMMFGEKDPQKRDYIMRSNRIAKLLNANDQSHFYRVISFDSPIARTQGFNTVAVDTAGNIGSSLYAASLMIHPSQFDKDEAWAAAIYVAAWRAIRDRTVRSDHEVGNAQVLEQGKMLIPFVIPGGSKGASKFITAIGNMLMWRIGFTGTELSSPDGEALLQRIAAIVDNGMDRRGQWSGSDVRNELRMFAQSFFEDMAGTATPFFDELPIPIFDVFPASNFALGKERAAALEVAKLEGSSTLPSLLPFAEPLEEIEPVLQADPPAPTTDSPPSKRNKSKSRSKARAAVASGSKQS